MYVYLHDLNEFYACWNEKGEFLCKGNQVSALWQKPGSAAEGLLAAEPAWEVGLSATEVAPEKRLSPLSGTFGRRRCRRTCLGFGSGGSFDRRMCRRTCPVQPSFACFCMIVLRCSRGFLGSSLELCSCMFGHSFESTCVGSDPRN